MTTSARVVGTTAYGGRCAQRAQPPSRAGAASATTKNVPVATIAGSPQAAKGRRTAMLLATLIQKLRSRQLAAIWNSLRPAAPPRNQRQDLLVDLDLCLLEERRVLNAAPSGGALLPRSQFQSDRRSTSPATGVLNLDTASHYSAPWLPNPGHSSSTSQSVALGTDHSSPGNQAATESASHTSQTTGNSNNVSGLPQLWNGRPHRQRADPHGEFLALASRQCERRFEMRRRLLRRPIRVNQTRCKTLHLPQPDRIRRARATIRPILAAARRRVPRVP